MAVLDPVKVVITNIPAPEVKHWSSCTIVACGVGSAESQLVGILFSPNEHHLYWAVGITSSVVSELV